MDMAMIRGFMQTWSHAILSMDLSRPSECSLEALGRCEAQGVCCQHIRLCIHIAGDHAAIPASPAPKPILPLVYSVLTSLWFAQHI